MLFWAEGGSAGGINHSLFVWCRDICLTKVCGVLYYARTRYIKCRLTRKITYIHILNPSRTNFHKLIFFSSTTRGEERRSQTPSDASVFGKDLGELFPKPSHFRCVYDCSSCSFVPGNFFLLFRRPSSGRRACPSAPLEKTNTEMHPTCIDIWYLALYLVRFSRLIT